jgi:hypothetical protein
MQRFLFIIITFSLALPVAAQTQKNKKQQKREETRKRVDALIKQEEEGVIAYKKHTAYGAKLFNDGYGAFLEIGRSKTVKKATLYQLEISERKSQKEQKLTSNSFNAASPLIYGKQNFFYPVKLGVQQQILIGNKSNKNGVSITGNYGGGLALALLRPYYVQIGNNGNYVKFESADSLKFLDISSINSGPGFSKGWNDLSVTPGAYLKTSLRFDYGSYNEMISAIEVGISGEFYSKKIPIMVHNPARQFFFNGYVSIIFGRRK